MLEEVLEIPGNLLNQTNEKVLQYLAPQSCHSDTTIHLCPFMMKLSDVKWFCPDPAQYRYVFWHVNNTVFAFGINMGVLGFKLPEYEHGDVEAEGYAKIKEAGEDWYQLPYDADNLHYWAEISYEFAKR